jgi:hypothetical protein
VLENLLKHGFIYCSCIGWCCIKFWNMRFGFLTGLTTMIFQACATIIQLQHQRSQPQTWMMTYHGPTIPLAGPWLSHCKWHWSSISELHTVCYNKKFEIKITLAHQIKSCTRFEVLAVVFQKIKFLWYILRDCSAYVWNIRGYNPNSISYLRRLESSDRILLEEYCYWVG